MLFYKLYIVMTIFAVYQCFPHNVSDHANSTVAVTDGLNFTETFYYETDENNFSIENTTTAKIFNISVKNASEVHETDEKENIFIIATTTTTKIFNISVKNTSEVHQIVNITHPITPDKYTTTSTVISSTFANSNTTHIPKPPPLKNSVNLNYLYFLFLLIIPVIAGLGVFYYRKRKKTTKHKALKTRQTKRLATPSWVFKEPESDTEDDEAETLRRKDNL